MYTFPLLPVLLPSNCPPSLCSSKLPIPESQGAAFSHSPVAAGSALAHILVLRCLHCPVGPDRAMLCSVQDFAHAILPEQGTVLFPSQCHHISSNQLLALVPYPPPCPFWFPSLSGFCPSPQEAFLLGLASRHRKPSASVALKLSIQGQDCHHPG